MNKSEQDVLAEFAALNTAIITCLKQIAMTKPDPKAFLSNVLDSGLLALETTNYWSVPADQKETFLENAKARYTDLVSSVRVD